MRIYSVGGSVRDMLLRQEGFKIPLTGDRDWVVVGATPKIMLAKGFKPVGSDFPVFLHPVTHEEYALARTERKTAPGYHGFVFHTSPDVSLEEDLRRRDLTINAIAMDEYGQFIDPYNGRIDIKKRVLRHVSNAFQEDPVRILRVARFAARFPAFTIANETMSLMHHMVDSGETDALVAERVWSEWFRAMEADAPIRFLDTLIDCGLWDRLFSSIPKPDTIMREALQRAVNAHLSANERIALLLTSCKTSKDVASICKDFRMPTKMAQFCETFHSVSRLIISVRTAEDAANLLEKADALRRPTRMESMITLCEIEHNRTYSQMKNGLTIWCSLNAGDIAKRITDPREIPLAIRQARIERLSEISFKDMH